MESVTYDLETETYRGSFDAITDVPTIAVAELMAVICDKAPTELPPLDNAVDTEALNQQWKKAVTSRPKGDCLVEFAYHDHRVTVKSSGTIEVRPLPADRGDTEEDGQS